MTEQFIDTPDEHEVQPGTLFCFLSENRPCNSDCVAYLTMRPQGDDYAEQGWSQCAVLVNTHRAGKHLTVLASLGSDMMKHFRIAKADATRNANNPTAGHR